jgi:D-aminopeptidase
MRNLITDIAGITVGNADDPRVASGATVIIFDEPAVASIAVHGGAPGLRDATLLEPEMSVPAVDGFVLCGGSAFGLDSVGGAMALMAEKDRGFAVGANRVPILPGAILFDLSNGGDKSWGRDPPFWRLGYAAAASAAPDFALGSHGAGLGATTFDLKGGLGSASATTSRGFLVGAIVAVNAVGRATVGSGSHFWAGAFERDGEFGGLGIAPRLPADALDLKLKRDALNTTIALVATDARLSKAHMKRIAIMAQDGPRADGRRRRFRRDHRPRAARTRRARSHRDRHARRRMPRPRHRARRL